MRLSFTSAVACAASLLLISCSSSETQELVPTAGFDKVVFYGTDRNRGDTDNPDKAYGEKRGELEYGIIHVSGTDEDSRTRLEAVDPLPRELFLEGIGVDLANAEEPTALVFVHGFLRSFKQASRLAAEVVQEMDFKGVPVIWSWPSTSNPTKYTVDETNIKWAQRDFAQFLTDILTESGAEKVHLVGHSLGGRGLVKVTLNNLLPAGVDLSRVGQFVLLAPDIDQDIFSRDMGPALVDAGLRVTLYASANDLALSTAHRLHGSLRAGDSSEGALLIEGIETIDVTLANRSILGHSYFEESQMVAEDLAVLINEGLSASQRSGLEPMSRDGLPYWRLNVDH